MVTADWFGVVAAQVAEKKEKYTMMMIIVIIF